MIIEIGLGIIVLVEGYVIWNLMRKTELLETWVEDFGDKVTQARTIVPNFWCLGKLSGLAHLMLKLTRE